MEREHKLWAAFMLVIIFVTPLGGNNGLYYIINNLFLVAPITMALMWNYLSTRYWSGVNSNENRGVQFVCNSMMLFLGICVVIQSILFGMGFVFHDAPRNGECYTQVQIQNSQSTKGLYTTVDKAEELNKLGGYLTENDLLEKEVILYGDIPAVSYIYDLQPAIYSTWVDLASNSLETLENELVSTRLKESKPLVIMSAQAALRMTQETEQKADKKLYAIYQFITDMKYDNTYSSEQFYVYEAP